MIIYSAEYNDCIHESAYSTISLHRSYEGACQAVRKHEQKTLNGWKKVGHASIPDYEKWRVREIEVLE